MSKRIIGKLQTEWVRRIRLLALLAVTAMFMLGLNIQANLFSTQEEETPVSISVSVIQSLSPREKQPKPSTYQERVIIVESSPVLSGRTGPGCWPSADFDISGSDTDKIRDPPHSLLV